MKWFKHDSGASMDARLMKVRHKYGMEGYGLYWYMVELIAGNVSSQNITFELEHDAETIALEWRLDQLRVQEMMLYMAKLGLFEANEGRITCLKLAKRLDDTNSKNPQIKSIVNRLNHRESPNNSDTLGETPSNSEKLRPEEKRLEEIRLEEKNTACTTGENKPPDGDLSPPAAARVPYQKILDLYHDELPGLPTVRKLTDTRRGYIRQRWLDGDLPDLDTWGKYFKYVSTSDFLMGRKAGQRDRPPFQADLAWLCRPENFAKVFEGKYHHG